MFIGDCDSYKEDTIVDTKRVVKCHKKKINIAKIVVDENKISKEKKIK